MYNWRKMSGKERSEALALRKSRSHPWHSPPHRYLPGTRTYLITAACFNHAPLIAYSSERLDSFTEHLHKTCTPHTDNTFAWCILPNHYHVLLQTPDLKVLLHAIGRLHGRTSFHWNAEENQQGRQVWFNCADREMRSYAHLMASINYVHHNPVRHGYVERWQDWPWSSAAQFVEELGRTRTQELWNQFPIDQYGQGWDDP